MYRSHVVSKTEVVLLEPCSQTDRKHILVRDFSPCKSFKEQVRFLVTKMTIFLPVFNHHGTSRPFPSQRSAFEEPYSGMLLGQLVGLIIQRLLEWVSFLLLADPVSRLVLFA